MPTVTLPLFAANARSAQNTSLVSPSSDDASKANYIVPQRSSLLDRQQAQSIIIKPTQPQPTPKNTATDAVAQAAVTQPPAVTTQTPSVAPAQPSAATALAPVTATPPAPVSTPQDTNNSNDTSQNDNSNTPPAATVTAQSLNSAPPDASTPPADASSAIPAQGNIIQTNAYSSVASATASTIRGVGINIVS